MKNGLHTQTVVQPVAKTIKVLQHGQKIDFDLYCQKFTRLNQAIQINRPELINRIDVFHHDNAKRHTFLSTWQKLRALGWEDLMHLSYSSDLASSDYHLFLSPQNFLNSGNFDSVEDYKNHLDLFFVRKFSTNRIKALP